ncbi:hypothetical protein V6N11_023295 [Hibiscus sabdariffa]|uniref:DUF4283 domain-containing protein n=1 Tax=Hibiscus sabdariffa TaxID=183260 RepID=A0ABR2TLV7_9ROSI
MSIGNEICLSWDAPLLEGLPSTFHVVDPTVAIFIETKQQAAALPISRRRVRSWSPSDREVHRSSDKPFGVEIRLKVRSAASDDSVLFDDDDLDLLEEDVNCGIKDGVPFIDFSVLVQELANKSMEYVVVLKLLGRRSDYLAALTDGPWTIFGHYITVELWSPNFDPSQAYPKWILAWIRLPGLPITWYKRSLLKVIGSCVGSVVKIDFQADNGRRGRFARMAVKINLNQPLVSKIVINGRTQLVVYESLPVVCFHYGTYGHTQDQCSRHTQVPNPPATTVSSPTPSPIQLPAESYGLWMLVERRKSRTIRTNSTSRPNDVPRVSQSRFNPLFSGNDHGHTPDISVATDSVESPAKHSEPAGGVTAPVIESAVEPVLETPTDTPTSVSELIVVPSDNKSKAKGKVTGGVRKHNSNVLGSRNLNIMPLKNSIGVHSSSSKISKGRHSHPVLNPEKHMTLTLDPTAPPISVTQNVQQSARLTADSSSMNATSVHTGSTTSDMHSGRSAMTE